MTYGPARALPGDQIRITTDPDTEPVWQAAEEAEDLRAFPNRREELQPELWASAPEAKPAPAE